MSRPTERQRQVIALAKAHYPLPVIARRMGLDLRTIHTHLTNAAKRRRFRSWRDFVPPFPADRLPADLPPRQRRILAGVMAGRSSKEIGAEVGTSAGAVRTAIFEICQRYGVRSRYDLAEVILQRMQGSDTP